MFYCFIITAAWLVWHIAFRIKIIGRENIPKDRGFVLCSNHISAIDPVFVVIARYWGRRLIIMGKEEIFNVNPILSWMFNNVGVIPVSRGKGDTGAVDTAIKKVKNGRGLLIFPEGTRSKDGNLGKLKSGAFVVAAQAEVDIVPCRLIYKGGKMKVFGRCVVAFGKPIAAENLDLGEPRSAARLRECKDLLYNALEELLLENKQFL